MTTETTESKPLSAYNAFDPAVIACPHDYYRKLRHEAPVYRDPQSGIVMVSKCSLVLDILRNYADFSSDFGEMLAGRGAPSPAVLAILAEGYPDVPTLISCDPPAHSRYRSLVNKAFLPRRIDAIEPAMVKLAHELIDGFIERGQCDLMRDFCVVFPLIVIADQLGVPRDNLAAFRRWSESIVGQLGQMLDEEHAVEAARDVVAFQRYFAHKIEEKRTAPSEDILSDLVSARIEGERPLSVPEMLSILQQLLVAGNETTASAIGEGIRLLIEHPEQLAKVERDPSLVNNLVEEVLRLSTPTANMWRVVRRDTEIGGFPVTRGSMILLRFASANRDEDRFDPAESFDVTRANAGTHVSFGFGVHFCVGAALARREMQVAFRALLSRLSPLSLAVSPGELSYRPNILLRGLDALPITFSPRATAARP